MKFRKKPMVIDAIQWTGHNTSDVLKFAGKMLVFPLKDVTVIINTLEGEMKAQVSDWIIRGVMGELYPCKPDVFEKTYEKVDG